MLAKRHDPERAKRVAALGGSATAVVLPRSANQDAASRLVEIIDEARGKPTPNLGFPVAEIPIAA